METADSNPYSERNELLRNLVSTYSFIHIHLQHRLAGTSLTIHQYNALFQLYKVYPKSLTAGQLKKKLFFLNTDLTRLGDRLVQKGLIVRHTNPQNRRQIELRLTPEAYAFLTPIVVNRPDYESILDSLTPGEVAVANQLFTKIKMCF